MQGDREMRDELDRNRGEVLMGGKGGSGQQGGHSRVIADVT